MIERVRWKDRKSLSKDSKSLLNDSKSSVERQKEMGRKIERVRQKDRQRWVERQKELGGKIERDGKKDRKRWVERQKELGRKTIYRTIWRQNQASVGLGGLIVLTMEKDRKKD